MQPEIKSTTSKKGIIAVELFVYKPGMKKFLRCACSTDTVEKALAIVNDNFEFAFFTEKDVVSYNFYNVDNIENLKP